MKTKTSLIFGVALCATVAVANDLPVVGQFDPRQASGYYPGVLTMNGQKQPVTIHNYGREEVRLAEEYGRNLAPAKYPNQAEFDDMVTRKGMELFHDPYFAHCFDVVAKQAYMSEMKREAGIR